MFLCPTGKSGTEVEEDKDPEIFNALLTSFVKLMVIIL